ncbi:MAG: uroporphyrinogen decarboxylase family protein [Lentisphaeria bacterium]
MRINTKPEHHKLAAELVKEAHQNNGLAPLDIDRFYRDQAIARKDPFGKDIPQVPLGIWMSGECVFDELGLEEDYWRYSQDLDWRLSINKQYNDKAEQIVGKRLLSESLSTQEADKYPPIKKLEDIFEAEQEWRDRSWWLLQVVDNPDALKALLDRVEKRLANLRDFMLPENWDEERDRLMAKGIEPPLYRKQRGPVTFAMSIYGVENLIFLLNDDPQLAKRFSNLILQSMLGIAEVLDREAGFTPENAPKGFRFADDNCALLTPEMYEMFGYPILKGIFDRYAPGPDDTRFQHSDSDMGHIVPILGELDLTGTNFGPTVMVDHIRKHLPRALIQGQLAPFTFSYNDEEGIVAEFLRDFEMAQPERGLLFRTAGSINNGSRLTGLRLIMAAIQRYGRYE